MSDKQVYFALYDDPDCTRMLPVERVDDKTVWVIDFGRVDAGEMKIGTFYVKNLSNSIIDEVEVELLPLEDKEVKVEITSDATIQRLEPHEIFSVTMKWAIDSWAEARRSVGRVKITGMRLEEGYRPPYP